MKHKIIFATGNRDKLREIREILGELGHDILSMKEAGFEGDIVEDGNKLSGQGVVDMGKGRKIPVSAEVVIDGDAMTGTLNIPLMKREIPLKNGHRVD